VLAVTVRRLCDCTEHLEVTLQESCRCREIPGSDHGWPDFRSETAGPFALVGAQYPFTKSGQPGPYCTDFSYCCKVVMTGVCHHAALEPATYYWPQGLTFLVSTSSRLCPRTASNIIWLL
jgi:hypothetical protein